MLASARVLGHVFDPLSVFWCYDSSGRLVCVVAEVHNTYRERHAYLLRPGEAGAALTGKDFHVSPFFDVSGTYELRFTLRPDRVATAVTLRREGAVAFSATFRGRPEPATSRNLARLLIRQPAPRPSSPGWAATPRSGWGRPTWPGTGGPGPAPTWPTC